MVAILSQRIRGYRSNKHKHAICPSISHKENYILLSLSLLIVNAKRASEHSKLFLLARAATVYRFQVLLSLAWF